ncbi:ribonuclease HI family protein [soil metagenome]
MQELSIHTDGGARGNPGPSAVGVHLQSEGINVQHGRCIGEATNNVAEYTGVLDAIAQIILLQENHTFSKLNFFLDSELVQRQLLGQYKVKDATLQQLHSQVTSQLRTMGIPFTFTHVRREQNKVADSLVNAALDGKL